MPVHLVECSLYGATFSSTVSVKIRVWIRFGVLLVCYAHVFAHFKL